MKIAKTIDSPLIIFDNNISELLIEGDSKPENVKKFYEPVFTFLAAYFIDNNNQLKHFSIRFKLDYFNSTSAKVFYELLLNIKKNMSDINKIRVFWHFDSFDLDIKEAGIALEKLLGLEFKFYEK